jgi:hypothetical protein
MFGSISPPGAEIRQESGVIIGISSAPSIQRNFEDEDEDEDEDENEDEDDYSAVTIVEASLLPGNCRPALRRRFTFPPHSRNLMAS